MPKPEKDWSQTTILLQDYTRRTMYKITCAKCQYNPITLKPHTSYLSSAKRRDGFFSLWTVY